MAYTVRTNTGTLDFAGKRSTGVLSDGSAVLLVPENNAGTRKWYLYHSTTRTSWTLKNTITPTAAILGGGWYSMVVDSSNNIHLTWKDTSGNIKYKLLTYSAGPTWSVGADETVGAAGGKTYKYLDIDVVTGTVACVMTVNYTDIKVRSWVRRSSDNTWVQLTDQSIAGSLPAIGGGISCARDFGGLVSGNGVMAYMARQHDSTGDVLRLKKFDPATGAQVSDTQIAAGFWANGNGYRDYMIFSKSSNQWTMAVLIGQSSCFVASCRFSGTAYIQGWGRGPTGLSVVRSGGDSSVAFGASGDGMAVIFKMGTEWRVVPVFYEAATGKARWGVLGYWQELDGVNGTRIYSGNNRNLNLFKLDTFDWRVTGGLVKSWFNQKPKVPTLVDPGSATIVTTDLVPVSVKMQNSTARPQTRMRGKWQVARDTAFTTGLQTITDQISDFVKVGTTQVLAGAITPELYQGTWYARAYQQTELSVDSSATGLHQFTVSHPPVNTALSPSGNKYYPYGTGDTTFTWRFNDSSPVDYETAYQVVVELNDDSGTVIADTGKVADVTPFPTVGSEQSATVNIDSAYKDVALKWYVKTWDRDDVPGEFSSAVPFYLGDIPTVAITNPASDGDTVVVPSPTIDWTFTGSNGRTQKARRIIFYKDGVTVNDTGWVADTGTTYTPPTPVLTNNNTYLVTVYLRDTADLENFASRTFVVTYTPPAAPTFALDPSLYASQGYVQVTWDDTDKDVDFNSWRVYRRKQGESDYVLVEEFSDDATSYVFQDWLLPSNVIYEYAVVQTIIAFEAIVESAYNPISISTTSSDYWLIHPTDDSLNVRLSNVTADDFAEEYESSTINLIGRGRKTDYGTRWGYTGTLTAQIRDNSSLGASRSKRQALEVLKATKDWVYLRNPFGDVWMVTLEDVQITRIPGVGPYEFTDVTIPYKEVAL